jgi:hypothetical protein
MPSQWSESAKRRGWGLWLFSGGTASVFGHCDNNCPRRDEFIQTAPKKAWRNKPLPEPPKGGMTDENAMQNVCRNRSFNKFRPTEPINSANVSTMWNVRWVRIC